MKQSFKLRLEFESGDVNGQTMSTNVNGTAVINDQVSLDITLPSEIRFEFTGKNKNDTVTDENGNIIADKFIKIKKFLLDDMLVPDWVLHEKFSYTTDDHNELPLSFIGHNGKAIINIPEDDVFKFYRRLMRG